jgi:hypothetical protein
MIHTPLINLVHYENIISDIFIFQSFTYQEIMEQAFSLDFLLK